MLAAHVFRMNALICRVDAATVREPSGGALSGGNGSVFIARLGEMLKRGANQLVIRMTAVRACAGAR